MKFFIFFLVSLFGTLGFSATEADVEKISQVLNREFIFEIRERGYQGFEIFSDNAIPDYYGGVSIVDQQIRFIVGSKALDEYDSEALKFISCHELGHLIGGAPFKPKRGSDPIVSTEGQSDYWAGSKCLPKLTNTPSFAALAFFKMVSSSLRDIVGDNLFYAAPKLDVQDDFFYDGEYPSFQCRLNTVTAGELGLGRPSCWYKP